LRASKRNKLSLQRAASRLRLHRPPRRNATQACAPRIEAQSPSDFDWISRPTPGIFQQADPSSPGDSVVRYRGDSIRFMAADKNWLRVSYECAYDVNAHAVVFVHVRSGRLDQPLTPGEAQTAPPAGADVARGAAPAAVTATAGAAAPAPKKARPRVGEPSRVEIQQQEPNPKPKSPAT
jgi:hypothetical protein